MSNVGDRVGVVVGTNPDNPNVVEFAGYGTYVGDEVPVGAVGILAEMAAEAGIKNPKIELDNGEVAWGCETWWGPQEKVVENLAAWETAGKEIVLVKMSDVRAKWIAEKSAGA